MPSVSEFQAYLDEIHTLNIPKLFSPLLIDSPHREDRIKLAQVKLHNLRDRIMAEQDKMEASGQASDLAQSRLNMMNLKPLSVVLDKITELETHLTQLETAKPDETPARPQIGEVIFGDYTLDIWKIGTCEQAEQFAEYAKVAIVRHHLRQQQNELRAQAAEYRNQAYNIRSSIASTEQRIWKGPISLESVLAMLISFVLVGAFVYISSNIESQFTSQWGYVAAGFGLPTLMVLGALYGMTDHFTKYIAAQTDLQQLLNQLEDITLQRLELRAQYEDLAEKIMAEQAREKTLITSRPVRPSIAEEATTAQV